MADFNAITLQGDISSTGSLTGEIQSRGLDGVGVPTGGTTGQVLAKASNNDYDTEWVAQTGGNGGTSDYTDLTNKASINGVTLSGNKTSSDLGVASSSHNHSGIYQPVGNYASETHTHDDRYYTESEITSLLSGKSDTTHNHNGVYQPKETGKGLSSNDYTTEEKNKLATLCNYSLPTASATTLGGIKVGSGLSINNGVLSTTGGGGTSVTVDTSMSDTSTNPVQNKVVKAYVDNSVANIPSGGGSSYNLPVATATTLGGVKPVAKTDSMTQDVGVDSNGRLYTSPSSGSSGTTNYSELTNKPSINSMELSGNKTSSDLGLASESHTHTIANVTDLQTTLNGKASSSHTHTIANVTNLQTTLNGKASASHSHSISEVTNLQTSLDGKASSSHTHTSADITDLTNTINSAIETAIGSAIGGSY